MIQPPSNSPSLFKRVMRRLGLDSEQRPYFFYIPNAKSEKGSLIAMTAVFMVVVAILIPVAMRLVSDTRRNTQQAQLYVAGAQNAAKAGLEDALGYFVRQNTILTAFSKQITVGQTPTYATGVSYVDQPFNPVYNTTNAAYSDTFQAVTLNTGSGISHAFYGLTNEYPLDAASNTLAAAGQTASVYFARYEVAEQPNPIATAGVVFTPLPQAVHDISGSRTANYVNGDGLTWAISSVGYIYERKDYTTDSYGEYNTPYNVYPNKVIATAKAYTEFKKLSCTVPTAPSSPVSFSGFAAVYASAAKDVTLSGYCYLGGVVANGYGQCAMTGSASATTPNGAGTTNFFGGGGIEYVAGSNVTCNAPLSDVNVFGMSLKDIQFIADYSGSSSIPMTIQEPYKLSYFNGNLTYGPSQSQTIYQALNTTGILVVNGNLTLNSGGANAANSIVSSSSFSGIVFATGNVVINPGCQLDGSLILGYSAASTNNTAPTLSLTGDTSHGYAYMTADPAGVATVIKYVAQYREDISARKVLLAFPGI